MYDHISIAVTYCLYVYLSTVMLYLYFGMSLITD